MASALWELDRHADGGGEKGGRGGLWKDPERERQALSHPSLHCFISELLILAFRGKLAGSAFKKPTIEAIRQVKLIF